MADAPVNQRDDNGSKHAFVFSRKLQFSVAGFPLAKMDLGRSEGV
jgi:hypothetical protein